MTRGLIWWKILSVLALLMVCGSVVKTMTTWAEARTIHDDLCYLRQAHLFRTQGWKGLDTNLLPGDTFLTRERLKAAQYPRWDKVLDAPCHKNVKATGKYAMQYPPGVGFLLAAFPTEVQVRSLYFASTGIVLLLGLIAVWVAHDAWTLVPASLFGCWALYLMINPAKSSFSLPPTMALFAVLGLLTARLVRCRESCLGTVLVTGILIGLSVNLRLANILLVAGYLALFGVLFLRAPGRRTLMSGALFVFGMVAGLVPTLAANTINAGHPLATAYSSNHLGGPNLDFAHIADHFLKYLFSSQGVLIACAVVIVCLFAALRSSRAALVGLVVGVNLLSNMAFYLLHPVYTPYYAVPLAMLSMWTLLFGWQSARKEEPLDQRAVS